MDNEESGLIPYTKAERYRKGMRHSGWKALGVCGLLLLLIAAGFLMMAAVMWGIFDFLSWLDF